MGSSTYLDDPIMRWKRENYLANLDLQNWYRFYFIIKEIMSIRPDRILEIGAGAEIVKRCVSDTADTYRVLDINPDLHPDFVSDMCQQQKVLLSQFDCIICADVLEHIEYSMVETCLKNIHAYLANGGTALITIPHRRINLVFLSSFSPYSPFMFSLPSWVCLTPRAFYSRFIKKELQKDPGHRWEIGDGQVKRAKLEKIFYGIGFRKAKFKQLFYVDLWVLRKD